MISENIGKSASKKANGSIYTVNRIAGASTAKRKDILRNKKDERPTSNFQRPMKDIVD